MNSEILLRVGIFTMIVLSLVVLILVAHSWLISSGDVTIEINPVRWRLYIKAPQRQVRASPHASGPGSNASLPCIGPRRARPRPRRQALRHGIMSYRHMCHSRDDACSHRADGWH